MLQMISISSSLSLGLIVSRPFHYVPYGENAPAGKLSLSCDGKVPGTALDLTHWTNNETPEDLYADTSTGIALNTMCVNGKTCSAFGTAVHSQVRTQGLQPWTGALL